MTTEKQKLIQSMLDMQKKFTAQTRDQDFQVSNYFSPSAEHPLSGYAEKYNEMANKLVDIAHDEKKSKR